MTNFHFLMVVLFLSGEQGVIQLRFSKVNELPLTSDDPGKYFFEIIPRKDGPAIRLTLRVVCRIHSSA